MIEPPRAGAAAVGGVRPAAQRRLRLRPRGEGENLSAMFEEEFKAS